MERVGQRFIPKQWEPHALFCDAPVDVELVRLQSRFGIAHNQWRDMALNLSPASPDYRERLRERWIELQVSEKFAAFERELMGEDYH